MTNGLRNHPGPGPKIRSYADAQRLERRHRLFWIGYVLIAAAATLYSTGAGFYLLWLAALIAEQTGIKF